MIKLTNELPPYENSGKGIPTTGAKPITIKTFILIFKNISKARPEEKTFSTKSLLKK